MTTQPASRPFLALLFIMGATISFTMMAVAGRELSAGLDTFEIMMWRSLIGFCIILVIIRVRGLQEKVSGKRWHLHLLRNLMHFTGQNLWFFAVAMIPISQLFAFEFSVPIWTALAAPFFLHERLTGARIAAAIVGFLGILLIARPDQASFTPGVIAAMLCAFAFTGTNIATKILTRTEATISVMFWLTLMQLCFGIIMAGYDLDIHVPELHEAPWVLLVGLCGLSAHFCLTSALGFAPATVVAPMDFARLPLAAIIGVMFYDEPLLASVLIGAVVIFGANFINILVETRKSRM